MLEVRVERGAGIDVAKKFVVVCVMTGPADQKPVEEVRRFGTSVKELERLRAWLLAMRCGPGRRPRFVDCYVNVAQRAIIPAILTVRELSEGPRRQAPKRAQTGGVETPGFLRDSLVGLGRCHGLA